MEEGGGSQSETNKGNDPGLTSKVVITTLWFCYKGQLSDFNLISAENIKYVPKASFDVYITESEDTQYTHTQYNNIYNEFQYDSYIIYSYNDIYNDFPG